MSSFVRPHFMGTPIMAIVWPDFFKNKKVMGMCDGDIVIIIVVTRLGSLNLTSIGLS